MLQKRVSAVLGISGMASTTRSEDGDHCSAQIWVPVVWDIAIAAKSSTGG